jgi:hypothetical protein
VIEAPRKLVYTWRIEPETESFERVTVQFEPSGDDTEVIVTHGHIASEELRKMHEQGWFGCLEGLAKFVEGGDAARRLNFLLGCNYGAQLLRKASVRGFKDVCNRSKVVSLCK